jgi:hypothetical protein
MKFADLQELHRQLGLRLRARASDMALREITVNLPVRDNDELSFIRLIIWCYALVNESGRVSMRFLRDLPPFSGSSLLPEAGHLRTWATHNLLPNKESDRKRLKLAWQWLSDACGTDHPSAKVEWRMCFERLVSAAGEVLKNALSASEALTSADDGPRLLEELGRRLERDWEAHQFDPIVIKVADSLGFGTIDAVEVRKRYLDSWRRVVSIADDGNIDNLLERRIEKDLLDIMNGALPLSAREYLERLPEWQPPELGALMLALRSTKLPKTTAAELLAAALALREK